MTSIWGVHNDQPQLDLVANGFISIGWGDVGDLSAIGDDRDAMKARVAAAYPDSKPGAIPGTAGTLLAFAYRMQPGDLVVYPYKPDSTLNFAKIEGDYYFEGAAALQPNRRRVKWLKTGVPRTTFSQTARYEIGSAVTVFRVKNHADEFAAYVDGSAPLVQAPADAPTPEAVAEAAADQPNAERIETYTRDFVIETLMSKLEGVQFEQFVAQLLRTMGYRTRVTEASGDGGVDIVAHRDSLGLEPPIIKVQCKRTTSSIGGPDVQRLTGTLAAGGTELGLFVTLGAYSKDAQHISRTRQDLRLINGNELVDLIFEHYAQFNPEYKQLLPMRSVYVVDAAPEATF